jgi:pimeloyl-ACP methyl ester carboxylesterase
LAFLLSPSAYRQAAKAGAFTHIFLFSHGWNNDWTVATRRYEDFLVGFMKMRREHQLPAPPSYKPLLVGVFWPSTALVFGEPETGPTIAGGDPAAEDARVAEERAEVRELAEALPDDKIERFYALSQSAELDEYEALELAGMLHGIASTGNDELGVSDGPSTEEIVKVWREIGEPETGDFGTVGGGLGGGPQAAGLLSKLDPRHVIRMFTVWQMKDRAGTVGAHGVGGLLRDLLSASNAKLHLIGHSYGAKIMLSAVGFGPDLPRKVESILLLQPAVSHLCFAENVPRSNKPGGYRPVLERVVQPIFSTFSEHDFPLRNTFHLGLRREEDLGEARIAAGDEPPSRYAALGGYGPRGAGEKLIDILGVTKTYALEAGTKIYGLRGHHAITGHGDISNESIWWALYSQVLKSSGV